MNNAHFIIVSSKSYRIADCFTDFIGYFMLFSQIIHDIMYLVNISTKKNKKKWINRPMDQQTNRSTDQWINRSMDQQTSGLTDQ